MQLDITGLNRQIADALSRMPHLDLLCLHGSYAAGTAAPSSDIDYYLLQSVLDPAAVLSRLSRQLPGYPGRPTCFTWEDTRVSFHILHTPEVVGHLRDMHASLDLFEAKQVWAQGYVVEALPLLDQAGLFREFQGIVNIRQPRIEVLFKESIAANSRKVGSCILNMGRTIENPPYYLLVLGDAVRFLLAALYAANRTYHMGGMKRAYWDMRRFSPDILAAVEYAANAPNEAGPMQRKADLLRAAVEAIMTVSGVKA